MATKEKGMRENSVKSKGKRNEDEQQAKSREKESARNTIKTTIQNAFYNLKLRNNF